MDKTKNESFNSVLLWLLITAALLYISVYILAVIVVIPFVFAYVMVRFGWKSGVSICTLALITTAIFDAAAAAVFAALAMPVAVAAVYVVRKKIRFFHSVLATSAAALAGAVMVIGVIWLFTRLSAVGFAVNRLGGWLSQWSINEISMFYQVARSMDIITGAITLEAVIATPAGEAITIMQEMFREWLNETLVSGVLIYSLLMGLLIYLLTRFSAKRRGTEVYAVPSFGNYSLPRWFWVGFLVSYLFSFIGKSYGWPSFGLAVNTISTVYVFVFVIQGLSFLDYFYGKRNVSPAMRRVMHVLSLLIVSGLLMLVGLFENVIGIRRRLNEKGDADS